MAKSLLKDVAKTAKNNAVKGISKAVFGTGVIGGALGKAFTKKFGDAEEEDTRVADALSEQSKVQDENSAILTRIETIVMNIADNVYNLAGIMNAQVVSMQEAQRLQQERAFKDAAAREEAAAESVKVEGPKAAVGANPDPNKKGGIKDTLAGIMESVGSTKKLFKGFLKKFGVLALGLTTVLGIGAWAASEANDNNTELPPKTETTPPGAIEDIPTSEAEASPQTPPASTSVPPPPAPTSSPPSASSSSGGSAASQPEAPPAATPAAPPPSVAATSPTSDPEFSKLEEYFNKPENAAERAQLEDVYKRQTDIKNGIKATKELMQGPQTPEEKARNEAILKILEPRLEATKKEKKVILDRARAAVGSGSSTEQGAAPTSAAPAGSSSGTTTSGGSSGGGISMSMGSSGGGAGATPIKPSPSTGTSISEASTSVAAASEPKPPKNNFVESSSSSDESSPPPSAIPTPIAGRGSLDVGTVFESES